MANPFPKGTAEAAMWDYEHSVNEYADTEYSWLDDLALSEVGYTPHQDSSEMWNIQGDQELSDMEMLALKELEEQSQDGLSARDKADLAKMEGNTNRQHAGRLGAVQQRMADRGLGGSGMDFALQQQAAQDATEMQAIAALEKEAMAQTGRRDATSRMGKMAGDMNTRGLDLAARKAQAQDVINRFNTGSDLETIRYNNDVKNRQAEYNNTGRQGNANRNVAHAGDVMRAKTGLAQSQYNKAIDDYNREEERKRLERERKAKKAGAVAGVAGAVAGGVIGTVVAPGVGTAAGAKMGQTAGQGLGEAYYAEGGKVPGEAQHEGDSYLNDTEQVNVSPGEIILPRSVADDPHASALFVEKENEKEGAEKVIEGLIEAMSYLTSRRK